MDTDIPQPWAQESTAVRALKDITYGSIAGMVSKVFEHPFDLTKVRLQAQVLDSNARFSGPIDCLKKTWSNEGVRGLYRGLPAPVVGAMAENASLFLSYGALQNVIRRTIHRPVDAPLSLPQLMIAAAGAGAITSFILTPVELVKCKMQVQMLVHPATVAPIPAIPLSTLNPSIAVAAAAIPATQPTNSVTRLPGPLSVLMTVIRTTGFRGLWLGHTGTLIRETGGGAAWFGTKEYVARLLIARRVKQQDDIAGSNKLDSPMPTSTPIELRPWESALSGACAGAAFNLALFPADTVKSAMQTEEELRPRVGAHKGTSSTFLSTLQAMYRAQGVKGLYAGCGITVARSIPSSAIIFLIYDGLNKYVG